MKKVLNIISFFVVIYLVLSICFMINLNNFNRELVNKSYVEIMMYKDGKSWEFLIKSLMYILSGCLLEGILWRKRREFDIEDTKSFITLFILMLLVFISCACIIYFIQNPILRAACVVIMGGASLILSNE